MSIKITNGLERHNGQGYLYTIGDNCPIKELDIAKRSVTRNFLGEERDESRRIQEFMFHYN